MDSLIDVIPIVNSETASLSIPLCYFISMGFYIQERKQSSQFKGTENRPEIIIIWMGLSPTFSRSQIYS